MAQWLQLEVAVVGKEISGYLNGTILLQHTFPQAVSGCLGLWSKGDTTAQFRELEMDDTHSEEQGI